MHRFRLVYKNQLNNLNFESYWLVDLKLTAPDWSKFKLFGQIWSKFGCNRNLWTTIVQITLPEMQRGSKELKWWHFNSDKEPLGQGHQTREFRVKTRRMSVVRTNLKSKVITGELDGVIFGQSNSVPTFLCRKLIHEVEVFFKILWVIRPRQGFYLVL